MAGQHQLDDREETTKGQGSRKGDRVDADGAANLRVRLAIRNSIKGSIFHGAEEQRDTHPTLLAQANSCHSQGGYVFHENGDGADQQQNHNRKSSSRFGRTRHSWRLAKYVFSFSRSRARSVEVKFESKSLSSLNLCIEYQYRVQPSGIMATKAKTWVHAVPVDGSRICCYEFDTDVLRDYLKEEPFVRGGDGRRSQFKLLPLKDAEQITTKKFIITINWDQFRPYWDNPQ